MSARVLTLATKMKPSKFEQRTWLQVKKLFGTQALHSFTPGQRNHLSQLQGGWDHIKGVVLTSQGTLQVAKIVGFSRLGLQQYYLVDGFHRVAYWMSEEDDKVLDACPFSMLNLEFHEVRATTKAEALDMVDAIQRSFNSKESVKKNGDFLETAIRQAGVKAKSSCYRTTSGILTYLKRVVGHPDQFSTPQLTMRAAAQLPAHIAMDQFLEVAWSLKGLSEFRKELLNAGVLEALFNRFCRLNDAERELALAQVSSVFLSLAGVSDGPSSSTMGAVERKLYAVFEGLTAPSFTARVRQETTFDAEYNFVRDHLRVPFTLLGSSVVTSTTSRARTKRA